MRRLLGILLLTGLLAGCGHASTGEIPPTSTGALVLPTPTPPAVQGEGLSRGTATPGAQSGATPVPAAASTPAAPAAALAPAPAVSPAAPAQFITVTVGSGDTLLGLALDHGVPMAAIQLQNDLGGSTVVQLGQQLVIPPARAWEGASPFWIVHEVAAGETLSEIGQAYGVSLDQLQAANGLADADLLSIGQALVLPLTDFATVREVAPTVAPTAAAAVAAAPTEPAAAGATSAEATPTQDVVAAVPPAPPPADVGQWPYEVVRIMNEVRASYGLPPLAYNETLAQAAQGQANDCAARGSCSHTGSDGADIKTRILRAGYQPASWAECWALRTSPQGAIDIWMDETPPNDPHRRTLLTTWLTEIGIGVAEGPYDGYYYFIADFGKPLR